MANPIAVLSVLVKAQGIAQVNTELAGLNAAGKTAAGSMTGVESKSAKAAKMLAKGLGVAAIGAGVAAGKMGADFEASMQKIVGLVGVNQRQVDKWSKQITQLSPKVNKSPAELADALYFLASSGLKGKDAFDALKISAKASSAGLGDMTAIADAVSSAMNAYGPKMMSAARATDILVGTAKAGKAEPEELAKSMGRVLPIASQMGVAFKDVGGAVAAMSLKGLNAAESVTSVRQMLQAIIKPTKQAKDVMAEYGLTSDGVKRSLKEKGLLQTLVDVKRAVGGNEEALAKIFPQVEGFNGVLNLTAAGGRKAEGVFNDVAKSTGSTDKAFRVMADTAKFKLGQAVNFVKAQLTAFGAVALPVVVDGLIAAGRATADVVNWFRQHETVTLAAAAAAGVVAAALVALRVAALVPMIPVIYAQVAAWTALKLAMLTNPIVLVVAALAALAAGVVVAYRESETFRKIIDGAWRAIKAVAGWLITAGVNAFTAVAGAVKDSWGAVRSVTGSVWGWLEKYLGGVFGALKTAVGFYFNAYRTIITTAWQAVKAVTETVWNAIKAVATTVWNALKASAMFTWEAIKLAILTPVRAARDVLMNVWGVIRTVATTAWAGLRAVAESAWAGIKTAILTPIRAVRDVIGGKDGIWSQIKEVAKDAWTGIRKAIKAAADPILDVILAPFKAAVKGVAKFAKLILQVVGKIPGVDTSGPVGAIDKFVEGLATGGTWSKSGGVQALARGGKVTSPIVMMGEEAPMHPEFVIPTNPAYRKRAIGLLGQAAGAIGFAKGGAFGGTTGDGPYMSQGAIEGLARKVQMPNAALMAAIAMAESGGETDAFGPPSGRGLWQIEWNVWAARMRQLGLSNPDNPTQNALMAREVLQQQGLGAWVAYTTGRHEQFMGKGQTGVVGNVADFLNPAKLIGKLPGVGDLPEWLGGFGKWTLDQVGDFIKKQAAGLVSGVVGGSVPGWGALDRLAQKHGLSITSTLRPGDDGYHGQIMGPGGRGRATDYSNSTGPTAQMMAFAREAIAKYGSQLKELFYSPLGWSIKNGRRADFIVGGPLGTPGNHYNHVHAAFEKGGIYGGNGMPYLGAYKTGGVLPADGFYYGHRGETVTPAESQAGGWPEIHVFIGDRELKDMVRIEVVEQDRGTAAAYRAGVTA